MKQSNGNSPGSPLDRYRSIEFKPGEGDQGDFTAKVFAGVQQRRRRREIRRQSTAVLTSVFLLVLTLQGVDALLPDFGKRSTSTTSDEMVLARADSALDELTSSSLDETVSKFFDYLNSDLPSDPASGLALYDDDAVEKALEELATFDLSSEGEDGETGSSAGVVAGV